MVRSSKSDCTVPSAEAPVTHVLWLVATVQSRENQQVPAVPEDSKDCAHHGHQQPRQLAQPTAERALAAGTVGWQDSDHDEEPSTFLL